MRGGKGSPGPEPVPMDGEYPLVVPVMSAAGGVGRSTMTALLAAALNWRTADSRDRAVAICDIRPRCASPWPGWLDHTAERGTGWLAACSADARRFAREVPCSASAIDVAGGRPVWVFTDTGSLSPSFWGTEPGPWFWAPVLGYLRAAVIDADPMEGYRLARQRATGEPGAAAAWMTLPRVRTTALWVTDPSPSGLSRTLEAVTAAEECGLPMDQLVVAINDCHGHGLAARSRTRRTLLSDRVGAIVEIGHDGALRRDGRPSLGPDQLGRREITDLVDAVIDAAGQLAAPEPGHELAERTPRHVGVAACPVPANR